MAKVRNPSIPATSDDPKALVKAVQALKESMEIAQRLRGDPLDSFVRLRELQDLGILRNPGGDAGVVTDPTDHGALTGLLDDDHTQYFNQARGDARYLRLTGGTLTGLLTSTGSIRTSESFRATGWNHDGASGPGAELGVSGGVAYLQSYNRTTLTFGVLNLQGSSVNLVGETGSSVLAATDSSVAISGLLTSTGSIRTSQSFRAAGWYDSAGSLGGMGAEMGVSGGEAWFIAYDRNASSFGGVNLQGSRLRLLNASGTLIEHRDFGTGSSRQINIYGTTSTAYFYYGPNEDVYLRPGTGSGTVYMDYGAGVSIGRPVGINAGTSQPLSLTTTSANPWHMSLSRADLGYTTRLWTRGQGVYFEHPPQFSGFYDLSGSGRVLLPSVSGSPSMFNFYSNHSSESAIRLLDAGGIPRAVFYSGGSSYGILDGALNWRLQIDGSSSTATFHGLDVRTSGDSFYAAGGYRWNNDSSFYIYNTSGYTYGSWRIGGARGGYVGIVLDDFGKRPTFMSNNDAAGIYEQGISAWQYYCQSGLFRIGSGYKPYFDGGPGAMLHYIGGQTSGRITVSTSGPSGTPADGDIWIQRAA